MSLFYCCMLWTFLFQVAWVSVIVYRAEGSRGKSAEDGEQNIDELSFTELRDKLIALDPLNKKHIISINKAEAEFWRKSEGYRVGWSDEILGFDCGGQQWVSEACFPAGKLANPSMKDLEYIEELKQLIEKEEIPAPAPIEQRWTASSRSSLSPASSPSGDDIFSWVIKLFPGWFCSADIVPSSFLSQDGWTGITWSYEVSLAPCLSWCFYFFFVFSCFV